VWTAAWLRFGYERYILEAHPLKRWLLRWWGWRQIGPRIRFGHLEQVTRDLHPKRILEIGCGWGQNLFALNRRWPSTELVGVDQDGRALAEARRIAQELSVSRLRFVQATLPTLPVDGPFDLLLIVDVLEYIVDDREVLRRLRTVTAPHGRLLLHVPHRITDQRRYLPVSHAVPGHVRPEYTRAEIEDVVRAAGWVLHVVHPTFGPWGTIAWECSRASERCGALGAIWFPLILGLARLDVCAVHREGNGYLLVASPESGHG